MADLVTYGPWTLYKSPEYDAAVKQQELDAEMERQTKKYQQDLIKASLEKAQKEQQFLQSPAGQEQLRLEGEKAGLQVEKLKAEIAAEAEKTKRNAPEYAPLESARLAGVQSQLKSDLETQQGLLSDVQNRISNLKSASAPLPTGVAGPVMDRDMATRMMRPALDVEAGMQQRIPATSAALAATNKQLGELVGTVPIPENLGGGTAPATSDISSIYKDRFEKLVPMKAQGISYINSLQPGSPERMAAEQTLGKMTGYEDAQTKKAAEAALKIPGLEGMASTEKGAKQVRDTIPDFISSVGGIDELLKLGDQVKTSDVFSMPRLMARADAIRTALAGQMRIAIGGPGTMTEQDRNILMTAIADPTTVINIFASDRLNELKKILARKFIADAKANGFTVPSLQGVIDAHSDPTDIESFGMRSKVQSQTPQTQPVQMQNFNSEAEARAAGKKDGDAVVINGKSGTLTP